MAFAIGAKRIPQHVEGAGLDIPDDAWRDAIDMDGAQVAVSPYRQADWAAGHGAADPPGQAGPRPGVRRPPGRGAAAPCTPSSGPCRSPNWSKNPSSTPTASSGPTSSCSTPAKAAAVERWYRHRTSVENIFRDSKHGAALRHLPSGCPEINTAWMWASLIAAAVAAWLRQLHWAPSTAANCSKATGSAAARQ